ncbi:methylation-associated defense system protein MAD4 [Desulfosarcina ovata]|uniref:DUF4276 family protein n=1 Tax=Desulfosarcina ovata subsp. ovata TaxID=2752305 RepID=A0A5K8A9Z5_9BACT|nr:hypothetical protein [Desulfosarcina ovata]BBO89387.1 hypothetical protein DSCOOX_25670 [Desulfosarcina ovata subsp. ovata]
MNAYEADLAVLTADKNMKFALEGLLSRPQALAVRPISAVFYIHPESDPGCLLHADAFLRPFARRFAHAIVMFDREGCGQEEKPRDELEKQVTTILSQSGWAERAAVIVIDPELENWVFSDSPEVDAALGWKENNPPLRKWLENKNYLLADQIKPARPKEAMEEALRYIRMPRSSSIYGRIARKVSVGRCTDDAFQKLKAKLHEWFPPID